MMRELPSAKPPFPVDEVYLEDDALGTHRHSPIQKWPKSDDNLRRLTTHMYNTDHTFPGREKVLTFTISRCIACSPSGDAKLANNHYLFVRGALFSF